MAIWPIVRNNPFVSLLVVVMASLVLWFVTSTWGPIAAVALVALTCAAVFAQYRKGQRSDARAAVDTFTFADVVDRMHAKDEADAPLDAPRR